MHFRLRSQFVLTLLSSNLRIYVMKTNTCPISSKTNNCWLRFLQDFIDVYKYFDIWIEDLGVDIFAANTPEHPFAEKKKRVVLGKGAESTFFQCLWSLSFTIPGANVNYGIVLNIIFVSNNILKKKKNPFLKINFLSSTLRN